jgi:Ni/Co efflux regulator RcnB
MRTGLLTAAAIAFSLTASTVAFADPPHGRGHGNHDRHHPHRHYDDHRRGPVHVVRPRYEVRDDRDRRYYESRDPDFDVDIVVNFPPRDVVVVPEYYGGYRPYPPGHAKRWRVGHPLPREVVYYEVPPDLLVRLEPPSRSYRYVRVGSDILKLAVGTGLVVDAIEGLGRRG